MTTTDPHTSPPPAPERAKRPRRRKARSASKPPAPMPPAPMPPPPPSSVVGDCPDWVHPDGRATWLRLVACLGAARVLREMDAQVLIRYCDAWARWCEAARFINQHGEFHALKNKQGQVTGFQNFPQTGQYHRYHKMCMQLERELGLTPAARARLIAERDADPFSLRGRESVEDMKRRLFFAGG